MDIEIEARAYSAGEVIKILIRTAQEVPLETVQVIRTDETCIDIGFELRHARPEGNIYMAEYQPFSGGEWRFRACAGDIHRESVVMVRVAASLTIQFDEDSGIATISARDVNDNFAPIDSTHLSVTFKDNDQQESLQRFEFDATTSTASVLVMEAVTVHAVLDGPSPIQQALQVVPVTGKGKSKVIKSVALSPPLTTSVIKPPSKYSGSYHVMTGGSCGMGSLGAGETYLHKTLRTVFKSAHPMKITCYDQMTAVSVSKPEHDDLYTTGAEQEGAFGRLVFDEYDESTKNYPSSEVLGRVDIPKEFVGRMNVHVMGSGMIADCAMNDGTHGLLF